MSFERTSVCYPQELAGCVHWYQLLLLRLQSSGAALGPPEFSNYPYTLICDFPM
ncbi:unnamed protein product [Gulo gulo]|uniref:Uncharacterized protein n=1 Tax=Gulo gulo TaxID=48420 RepID=A0A9X9M3H6_GULGU|nr:unnamed protein product [Gulo gulo]